VRIRGAQSFDKLARNDSLLKHGHATTSGAFLHNITATATL